jgi:phosphatidate cytidylyltransferase
MGALLIVLTVGMLAVDRYAEPWYPFLFAFFIAVAVLGTVELLDLLPGVFHVSRWLCLAGVLLVVSANWPPHVFDKLRGHDPWHYILSGFAAVVLAAFVAEMVAFRGTGGSAASTSAGKSPAPASAGTSVVRVALPIWIVAYLALLPSFLAQLRWMANGAAALALCIFVPKSCDIGAYVTGSAIGRHRMTPVLSPKKTWEGLAGGVVTAMLVAFAINHYCEVLSGPLSALGFGLVVGMAGALGDLAESLIKRDCQRKDASAVVPGFGGVLDVIDAVVFAAPVAYWWIRLGI